MTAPLSHYMKVGLVHFMAFPETMKGDGPIVETIKKVVLDDYFNAIEITTVNDPDIRQNVKRLLEASHMQVAFAAQPRLLTTGLNLNDTNEDGRQKALANAKEGIDQAYELGASGFSFLSGRYDEADKENAFQLLVDSTNELCAYAKSKGDMKISLEVFDYDVDKKSLIGPADLALRYAQEIRKTHDHFGLMVDLSHIPLIHETIEESLLPVKDYITHAHVGNCVVKSPDMPAYGDVHPRFGFPNGENDVAEVAHYLKVLLDIGYLNTENPPIFSFEVKPFGDEDPDVVIANAKRTLNEAWARV
ncbi:sugar phosphate isomerase/epimerase family protein [Spirosoma panaciterrae]|uniref:sugar phosphate isomerase/epimerase family protein n=1 Tax=Spirosoma panaciterrae TaxID=496058 RepID=UPI00039E87C8|nr:TIM barrel protein [Spirosoma panaciterrae]